MVGRRNRLVGSIARRSGVPAPVRIGLALVAAPIVLGIALVVIVVVAIGAAASDSSTLSQAQAQAQGQGSATCAIDPKTAAAPPANLIPIYQEAATSPQYRLGPRGWAVLAAINRIETNFGRNLKTSSKGAVGWMQFIPDTWARYKIDADGGGADPNDPQDAIHSAANYLHSLLEQARRRRRGHPPADYDDSDWRAAVWGYNHAGWYVDEVLLLADAFQGSCSFTDGGAVLGSVVRLGASDPWLSTVPGTNVRCDTRIIGDVTYLLQRFNLRLGSCYAPTGHSASGEHPLGLAVDVTPADGNWDHTMQAAHAVGWSESCAARGCPNPLARWIGYNGVADHGDPQHCTGGCPPHLHISWNHAAAAYNTQAAWVDVWNVPSGSSVEDRF